MWVQIQFTPIKALRQRFDTLVINSTSPPSTPLNSDPTLSFIYMAQNHDKNTTLKVAFYIRVSTKEQGERGDGYGLDLQKDALESLIKSRGKLPNGKNVMELAGPDFIYVDDGVSGTVEPDLRPAFSRLKADILLAPDGTRPFDIVFVYKIDRFARKLSILLEIIDFFKENGIGFASAHESIDTSTPFGEAILGILGVISELEIKTIAMRTQDGRMQALKKGVVMGSYATYGYRKDQNKLRKVFKKEAEVVKEIFNLCVTQKLTPYQIAEELKRKEILTPEASAVVHGKKSGSILKKTGVHFWRPQVVLSMLRDDIYTGKIYLKKGRRGKYAPKEEWELAEVKAPIIIDLLTFNKAQKLLDLRKHEKPISHSGHKYLLSGLLTCEACNANGIENQRIHWIGERKKIGKEGERYTYLYRCGRKNKSKHEKSCNAIPLPASEIENYIINFCKKIIENPQATYDHQKQLHSSKLNTEHLQKRHSQISSILNTIPDRKERLKEMRELGHISLEQMDKDFKNLNDTQLKATKELEKVMKELSGLALSEGYEKALNIFSESYRAGLDKILKSREETYILLHELIEEITVFSRPLTDKDKVAGKRKKDQMIPSRLHLKLKLPQDILYTLTQGEGFGVTESHLSG